MNLSHPNVDGHAATARSNIDNALSSDEKSKLNRLPTLSKYGGNKKNILVNLKGGSVEGDGPKSHTKSMRNLS